jgi:23S rRNA pseudouridine1911/1915/1917 synthase
MLSEVRWHSGIATRIRSAVVLDDDVAVVYEDAHLLAVDKPAGLVTHPAYRHPDGTLCDAVFARQAKRGEARPWLLHRLDRETSGILLFAKTEAARRALVRQFERRSIRKRYLAILRGQLDPLDGIIDAPLRRDPFDRRRTIVDAAGQSATTRYRTLATGAGLTLTLAEPLTGRTHQIRAHFAWEGAPLLGDARYAPEEGVLSSPPSSFHGGEREPAVGAEGGVRRAMLHAWQIGFRYPQTGEPCCLSAAPSPDFMAALRALGIENIEIIETLDSVIATPLQEATCN